MAHKVSGVKNSTIIQLDERFETDRFGVDMVFLKVQIPDAIFPMSLLPYNAAHPRFSSTQLVKRSGSRDVPGFWTVGYTFEGFLFDTPEPIYELSASLDQEPIECHPDFVSKIGGKPSAPLNGAVFVAPDTGLVSGDDDEGVFREFKATISGTVNKKGGVESYLVPGAEWRVTEFSVNRPTSLRNIGERSSPDGPNPSLSGHNWLMWSQTYQKRGGIYQITSTWKLSGRNGWDTDIY